MGDYDRPQMVAEIRSPMVRASAARLSARRARNTAVVPRCAGSLTAVELLTDVRRLLAESPAVVTVDRLLAEVPR